MTQTTIAILAGGQSRRMGTDKAGIVIGGERLLERTARMARMACSSVIVVGRSMPTGWAHPGVSFRPDGDVGQGPLGGLATALEHAGESTVLLVACDMPLLMVDALKWLLRVGAERAPLEDGLVTVNNGRWEPLFSLYTPESLPLVQRRRASGQRSMQGLIDAGRFAFADAPPGVQTALRDVDTPEDLANLAQSPTRSP